LGNEFKGIFQNEMELNYFSDFNFKIKKAAINAAFNLAKRFFRK